MDDEDHVCPQMPTTPEEDDLVGVQRIGNTAQCSRRIAAPPMGVDMPKCLNALNQQNEAINLALSLTRVDNL